MSNKPGQTPALFFRYSSQTQVVDSRRSSDVLNKVKSFKIITYYTKNHDTAHISLSGIPFVMTSLSISQTGQYSWIYYRTVILFEDAIPLFNQSPDL